MVPKQKKVCKNWILCYYLAKYFQIHWSHQKGLYHFFSPVIELYQIDQVSIFKNYHKKCLRQQKEMGIKCVFLKILAPHISRYSDLMIMIYTSFLHYLSRAIQWYNWFLKYKRSNFWCSMVPLFISLLL